MPVEIARVVDTEWRNRRVYRELEHFCGRALRFCGFTSYWGWGNSGYVVLPPLARKFRIRGRCLRVRHRKDAESQEVYVRNTEPSSHGPSGEWEILLQ